MDILQFKRACEQLLDLDNLHLSESYNYNSIACCIVDAVYSIGVRYESTKNTVASFCRYVGIERYRSARSSYDMFTVSQLIQTIKTVGAAKSADVIFHNHQRTSTRNGILKSEAVLRFAEVLFSCWINTFADFQRKGIQDHAEKMIQMIPGQKSGLALHYFYMLAGNDDFCKPDRHVIRFISHYTGTTVKIAMAAMIMKQAAEEMKVNYPELTVRLLDYAIWNYAKGKRFEYS